MSDRPLFIATRGSALALAQANIVATECRRHFPGMACELKIIKTTGDKLQTASLSRIDATLPRGLFTKELEEALFASEADIAVHSLKDLPTELPPGLTLGGVGGPRADVRDVLIYCHDGKPLSALADFPRNTVVATSSTRRKAQLLALRPDFNIVEIRGNVPTRLQKLAAQDDLDGTILALAGLARLGFQITASGQLQGGDVPAGLSALILDTVDMLPCVGQGAIGLEIRENDHRVQEICARLNHQATWQCINAERTFLRAMGGGCQSPVGAYAKCEGNEIHLQAISFLHDTPQRGEVRGPVGNPAVLGKRLAAQLK